MTELHQGVEQSEAPGNEGWTATVVPVRDITERAAADYSSCNTFAIVQAGTYPYPTQLLVRNPRRHKAYIEIYVPSACTITFNTERDPINQGQGYSLTFPVAGWYSHPVFESQKPFYAVCSIAGVSAAVRDETYAER